MSIALFNSARFGM